MTVCMYRDIHTLQPYIIDFTQRGCHTLRLILYKIWNTSFWCSISFIVQGVLRVEGGHFQHVLRHVLSIIYYMQKCHWAFHAPGFSFQLTPSMSFSWYAVFEIVALFIAVSHVLQITSIQKVSLLDNSNIVVARCQHWVRSGGGGAAGSTYRTENFSSSVTTTLIVTSDIKIHC